MRLIQRSVGERHPEVKQVDVWAAWSVDVVWPSEYCLLFCALHSFEPVYPHRLASFHLVSRRGQYLMQYQKFLNTGSVTRYNSTYLMLRRPGTDWYILFWG